jgi:hypothetical protein
VGAYTISALKSNHAWDPAAFAGFSRSGPLSPEESALLAGLWERVEAGLCVRQVANGTRSWLLAWLPAAVEEEVDALWAASPRQAYLAHCLAVHRLMALAGDLIPELAGEGCAPAPEPSPELAQAARELGLCFTSGCALDRRYALITPYPFVGGCAACVLESDCPRLKQPLAE